MEQEKKKRFSFRSLSAKVIIANVILCAALIIIVISVVGAKLQDFEESQIASRLESDIKYLEDTISNCQDTDWEIKDGALYKGDVLVGDGTEENANIEPFLETEDKTGTFCYSFMKCSDEGLKWTGDKETGYMQGHYIRTAGSTLSPTGESIVGTYIDKKVADELDANGTYSGPANVTGGMIYCLYNTLENKDGEVVGAIVVGRSMNELNEQVVAMRKNIGVIIFAVIMLFNIILAWLMLRSTNEIIAIDRYLSRISREGLPEDRLHVKNKGEIGSVAKSVNSMVDSLKDSERIGAELSLATDIQANMLPSIFPAFPNHDEFDIFATMTPAKEVGGDFYDFFMVDDTHVAVVIADVSGKGVPAALFMVTAKTLIKDHAQLGLAPAEVFIRVNRILCEGNKAELFVTGWMGILDIASGKLTYVNAGHNPPLIQLENGNFEYLHSRPGFVLAGMEDMIYKQQELTMKPGDKLYLYTDGVTEATDVNDELYGEDRLEKYLNEHKDDPLSDILTGLRSDIDEFVGEAEQFDDITMLIMNFEEYRDKSIIEKSFEASRDSFDDALAFIETEMEKHDVPMKIAMQFSISFEEVFVNIANYAYQGRTGDVKLALSFAENQIVLKFKDSGIPFNPLEKDNPDITLSADDRDIGGLGIYLVRQSMDEVRYDYIDGMNILTIVKKY